MAWLAYIFERLNKFYLGTGKINLDNYEEELETLTLEKVQSLISRAKKDFRNDEFVQEEIKLFEFLLKDSDKKDPGKKESQVENEKQG